MYQKAITLFFSNHELEITNEAIDFAKVKERIKTAIDTAIANIKKFVGWTKNKVMAFFDKIKERLSKTVNLKKLLTEVKEKRKKKLNESIEVIQEQENDALEKWLDTKIPLNKNYNPNYVINYIKKFGDYESNKILNDEGIDKCKDIFGSFEKYCNYLKIDPSFFASNNEDKISYREFIDKEWQSYLGNLIKQKSLLQNYINDLNYDLEELNRANLELEKALDILKSSFGDRYEYWVNTKTDEYHKIKDEIEKQLFIAQHKISLNTILMRNICDYIKSVQSAIEHAQHILSVFNGEKKKEKEEVRSLADDIEDVFADL